MKEQFYRFFLPRIEPEQRLFQIRFLVALCSIMYGLLAIWSIYYIASLQFNDIKNSYRAFEILPIVILAVLNTWLRTSLEKKEIVRIGIYISILYFLLGISLAVFHPTWIYVLVPIFIASIAIIGTLFSGGMVFITAAGNLLVVILLWLYGRSLQVQGDIFEIRHGVLFLSATAFTLSGTAILLNNISTNMQRTLRLLNDRTQQLVSLAHTDPLTELANRRFLIEILEREFCRARRYNRPLSLIYLDLDGFKTINDRFGHLLGDEILKGTAVSMKGVLRSTDLLARIGGDEFAVLLPETDLEGSEMVARKLRRALSAYSAQLKRGVPPLTFCSGVSVLHHDDQSIDDMLSRADDAQYLAKRTGKAHTRLETEVPGNPDARSGEDS